MSYGVTLSWQISSFFMSMGLGFFFGLIYDVILSSVTTFSKAKWAYILSDLSFSVLITLIFFCYTLIYCQGETRLFNIIASFIGAVVFHFTLGKIISSVIKKLMGFIKAIIKIIFSPFIFTIRFIKSKLTMISNKLIIKAKENIKRQKSKKKPKKAKSTGDKLNKKDKKIKNHLQNK